MEFVQPIRDIDKIEEIKSILRRFSNRNYFLFVFGINVGMRISDILGLQVRDILKKSHIQIIEGKTGKVKKFRLMTLQEEIVEYTQGMRLNEYVFASRQNGGKPITRSMAYRILNGAAKKSGVLEIGTHTLRKTFGYHFYKRIYGVALLQRILITHRPRSP